MMEYTFGFVRDLDAFIYLGLGLGFLFIFFGIYQAMLPNGHKASRMRRASHNYLSSANKHNLMKRPDQIPAGLLKALVPIDRSERTQIRLQLEQAGFIGSHSVRNFFLMRLVLALLVPIFALVLISIRAFFPMPSLIVEFLNSFGMMKTLVVLAMGVAVGFYGPTYWLSRRIKKRSRTIEESFPNAMDLMQISSEAGMGFDAAMTKVGQKLANVAPTVSQEFLLTQTEILAGRSRKEALSDMADRMGIEEARSFVNVIVQSLQYGSSVSDALKAYAVEMRETRELKAQEKANKLPVQMSAIMASLMLPALFLITLGPTIIKFMEVFGD